MSPLWVFLVASAGGASPRTVRRLSISVLAHTEGDPNPKTEEEQELSMSKIDTKDIEWLLREAVLRLERGELDCAAWRLADAGGLLRARLVVACPNAELIGLQAPTGLGYLLPYPLRIDGEAPDHAAI